jgi:hypothetical protein
VTEDVLAKNRAQLERLVDLYLSGEFPKEVLAERKARFERLIADLESQKAEFMEHLASRSLTIEQIKTARDLAEQINARIDAIDEDFGLKRQLVEILDLRVTLAVEDEKKIVYLSCHLGDDQLFLYCASEQKLASGKHVEHDGRWGRFGSHPHQEPRGKTYWVDLHFPSSNVIIAVLGRVAQLVRAHASHA